MPLAGLVYFYFIFVDDEGNLFLRLLERILDENEENTVVTEEKKDTVKLWQDTCPTHYIRK